MTARADDDRRPDFLSHESQALLMQGVSLRAPLARDLPAPDLPAVKVATTGAGRAGRFVVELRCVWDGKTRRPSKQAGRQAAKAQ